MGVKRRQWATRLPGTNPMAKHRQGGLVLAHRLFTQAINNEIRAMAVARLHCRIGK